MWWCQFIDRFKFETRPSSLLNFGTAYYGKENMCPLLFEYSLLGITQFIYIARHLELLWRIFQGREIARQLMFATSNNKILKLLGRLALEQ